MWIREWMIEGIPAYMYMCSHQRIPSVTSGSASVPDASTWHGANNWEQVSHITVLGPDLEPLNVSGQKLSDNNWWPGRGQQQGWRWNRVGTEEVWNPRSSSPECNNWMMLMMIESNVRVWGWNAEELLTTHPVDDLGRRDKAHGQKPGWAWHSFMYC